ncbi:Protein of unknown function DUF833 domain-containing protein [Rozella allomycis CSF55]|uniref:DUF833-domain-containing protein n=1 Tax=Rozella allomycis (strain CSF55) TaxID=988480 RepID=A0A075B0S9_ROZAC|nr:Protein of unknown function DUF833 domain-containing protein [Rozella allomycis CSF55]|eukprot:EPZ36086.1 Protein of unknown function DUF833 domain-containing protein [Rozella allomycis CSF55]
MCIVAFAFLDPGLCPYKFLLISNRDEFYDRKTNCLGLIEENIYGGRDLEANGTWIAVNAKTGILGFLTNIKSTSKSNSMERNTTSRGYVVLSQLSNKSCDVNDILIQGDYEPFNAGFIDLINSDGVSITNFQDDQKTNRLDCQTGIINVVSNIPFNNDYACADFPKVALLKASLQSYLLSNLQVSNTKEFIDGLFNLLKPKMDPERTLEPLNNIFVPQIEIDNLQKRIYGTRSSTVMLLDKNNEMTMVERNYIPDGANIDIKFQIGNMTKEVLLKQNLPKPSYRVIIMHIL